MVRFLLVLSLLLGCLPVAPATAAELTGLQPGFVEKSRMELSTTKGFSAWNDLITVKLSVESQGQPLIAWGDAFLVAHGMNRVTLKHDYPDILPHDAKMTKATMTAEKIAAMTSVETEANIGEIGRWLNSQFEAYGNTAGSITINHNFGIGIPVVFLEYRLGDGQPVQTFMDSFAGQTYNLNLVTDSPDILNLSFKVKAVTYDPLNENAKIPAPGVQVRARYVTTLPTYEEVTFYRTPWFETDKDGLVMVDVGGGGAVVETVRDLLVAPSFAGLQVVGTAAGFCEVQHKIEDLYTFNGKLKIRVKDPLGHPITGARLQLQGAVNSGFIYTNTAGEAEVQVNSGGSAIRNVDITLAPSMTISASLTQIVDDVYEHQIHSESPAFYVAKFAINNTALSYLTGGGTFGDFMLRIYENNNLAAEISGLTAKCAETMTPADHANGVNAYFYPVMPEATTKQYRHQLVWKDSAGNDVLLSYLGGSRNISEKRVPALDRPFRIHFVGIDTAGAYKAHKRGIIDTWASPSRMSIMNDYFKLHFPAPVEFTYGPDLKTTDPWFTFGPFRVLSYFVDLARLRETMPDRPDLIVGVSAAGAIGADGLSEPRFRNVILLDGTGMRESYLLHEYMHTLGLLDDYNYETGTGNRGASANGFDPRTMRRIFNTPGADKPAFQTVMYDRAPQPWLTTDDYSKLVDEATVVMMETTATDTERQSAGADSELAAAPQEVMLIGATYMGRQSWSDYNYSVRDVWPIFIDTDTVWQPQEGVSPSQRALGVRLSNGQTASVRENTTWIGMYNPSGDAELAAAPLFKFPYDPAVKSLTFESHHHGGITRKIHEVAFSPHAPTVRIESPAAKTPLSGAHPIKFVAEDVDAGEQLYAWVKVSGDGGASWRPVGTWFPIQRGQNTFDLPCDDLPSMAAARLRVLVSDGTRSARAEAGPYPLQGFATTPRAEAHPPWLDVRVKPDTRFLLPVRITNTGRAPLEVKFKASGTWVSCRQTGPQVISWGGSFEFLFDCTAKTVGVQNTQIRFTTNDPLNREMIIPFKLNVVNEATPPVVASLTTDPPLGGGDRIAWERPVRFIVREATGRQGLTGRVDIFHADTGKKLSSVNLAAGALPGTYEAQWTAPANCLNVPLGVESFLLAGTLGSHGGSDPTGWDAQFQLMRRNTAPRFVSPAGNKNISLVFPQTLVVPFEVVDDEGDPISFAVDHTPELDVRLDAAARVLHVSYLTDVPHTLPQIRLAATDVWGATSGITLTVDIGWQMTNYGYLAYLPNFRLQSNPMTLRVAGGGTWEKPRHVLLEARAAGATQWTRIGETPFTLWDDLKSCWLAETAWTWPEDGTAVYEVRVTLVSSDGTADTQPPVYRFERPRQGGRVTHVEAPATVSAGAEFVLRIHVENASSERWSEAAGYGLRALDGIDPLTGLATAEFMALQQIERGSSAVVEIRARAGSHAGVYRTAWGLRSGSTPFGDGAEAYVEVVSNSGNLLAISPLIDVLLGRASIQKLAPGSLDLNGDGLVTVADLVTLVNRSAAKR